MPATPVWLAAIESVLNRSIDRSQEAQAEARRLERTSLQVNIEGVVRIRAAACAGRLVLSAGGEEAAAPAAGASAAAAGVTASSVGSMAAAARAAASTAGGPAPGGADAVISGTPLALLQLLKVPAAGPAAAASSRPRSARIAGDAEIAARYRELLARARPDLEEELARLIGDLPARRLSLAAQGAFGWARKLGRTARANLAEYLQEESRDVVSRPEVEEFVQGVDHLRDSADRVEARLARLEERLKGPA